MATKIEYKIIISIMFLSNINLIKFKVGILTNFFFSFTRSKKN